jgi:hypothetical protein
MEGDDDEPLTGRSSHEDKYDQMLSSKRKRDSDFSDPQRFGLQRRPPSVESLLCDRESMDVLPMHHAEPQRCVADLPSAASCVHSDQARGLPAHGTQSSALDPPTSSPKTENHVDLTNHTQAHLVKACKRLRLSTSGSKSALVARLKGAGQQLMLVCERLLLIGRRSANPSLFLKNCEKRERQTEQKMTPLVSAVTVPDTWGCYSRGLYSCAHFRSQRTTKQG